MRSKLHIFILPTIFFIFFVLYWYTGYRQLDPDFGWHLAMGKLIIKSGIPAKDPFSYSMPSYPMFVDHEWLPDILLALFFQKIGTVGFSFFFSFLAVAALWITTLLIPKEKRLFALIPLLFAGTVCIMASGIRMQIITWDFLGLLLYLLYKGEKNQKFFLAIPFLIFCWANLHGGFAISIPILFIACGVSWWQKKRFPWYIFFLTIISIGLTCINPYGWKLWREEWMTLSDPQLRLYINEWQPTLLLYPFFLFALWLYVSLSVIVWIYRKILSPFEQMIYVLFFIMGMMSFRNMPLWILISIPMTAKAFAAMQDYAAQYKFGMTRFAKIYGAFSLVSLCVVIYQAYVIFQSYVENSQSLQYPQNAIVFLSKHLPEGNIFVPYEWGGYLDWKLPQKKVFIDGRMPSWRWNALSNSESNNAFLEYREVNSTIPVATFVNKYHITTFLMPKYVESTRSDRNSFMQVIVPNLLHQPQSIVKSLIKNHFKKIYDDGIVVIYQK